MEVMGFWMTLVLERISLNIMPLMGAPSWPSYHRYSAFWASALTRTTAQRPCGGEERAAAATVGGPAAAGRGHGGCELRRRRRLPGTRQL